VASPGKSAPPCWHAPPLQPRPGLSSRNNCGKPCLRIRRLGIGDSYLKEAGSGAMLGWPFCLCACYFLFNRLPKFLDIHPRPIVSFPFLVLSPTQQPPILGFSGFDSCPLSFRIALFAAYPAGPHLGSFPQEGISRLSLDRVLFGCFSPRAWQFARDKFPAFQAAAVLKSSPSPATEHTLEVVLHSSPDLDSQQHQPQQRQSLVITIGLSHASVDT
jgi:hypothetical protein